jgi:hypothetical protein
LAAMVLAVSRQVTKRPVHAMKRHDMALDHTMPAWTTGPGGGAAQRRR